MDVESTSNCCIEQLCGYTAVRVRVRVRVRFSLGIKSRCIDPFRASAAMWTARPLVLSSHERL